MVADPRCLSSYPYPWRSLQDTYPSRSCDPRRVLHPSNIPQWNVFRSTHNYWAHCIRVTLDRFQIAGGAHFRPELWTRKWTLRIGSRSWHNCASSEMEKKGKRTTGCTFCIVLKMQPLSLQEVNPSARFALLNFYLNSCAAKGNGRGIMGRFLCNPSYPMAHSKVQFSH